MLGTLSPALAGVSVATSANYVVLSCDLISCDVNRVDLPITNTCDRGPNPFHACNFFNCQELGFNIRNEVIGQLR